MSVYTLNNLPESRLMAMKELYPSGCGYVDKMTHELISEANKRYTEPLYGHIVWLGEHNQKYFYKIINNGFFAQQRKLSKQIVLKAIFKESVSAQRRLNALARATVRA